MQDNAVKRVQESLLRQDALKAAYIFICFFVFGPLFGFLSFCLISEFGRSVWPAIDVAFILHMWALSFLVGGIQAGIVANVATKSFEFLGVVSLKWVLLKTLRVGTLSSAIFVFLLLVGGRIKSDFNFIVVSGAKFLVIHVIAASTSWLCVVRIRAHPNSGWIVK